AIDAFKAKLAEEGAMIKLIGPSPALVTTAEGQKPVSEGPLGGRPSFLFGTLFVAVGAPAMALLENSGDARHSLLEAYKLLKPIAVLGDARRMLAPLQLQADAG